jgi:hypothetical protein
MQAPRKPPSKHDWLQKTHCNKIPSWDLNQCIAYLSLSECTQIKKLPGGGTATESKELVHERLMKLIAGNINDQNKPDPDALAEVIAADAEEEVDFTALVCALNLLLCLVDGAFPAAKLPQVVISPNGSKEKALHDIANLHPNALLLMQTIHRPNSGRGNNNNNSARDHDDDDEDDDIASIVAQRQ